MGQTGVENRPVSIKSPDLKLETGEISDTWDAVDTRPELSALPFKWRKIADTPGFSLIMKTTSEDLNHAFPRSLMSHSVIRTVPTRMSSLVQ